MAQAHNAELLVRAQQLLNAAQPALAEVVQVAKRLYVAGEHFESRMEAVSCYTSFFNAV